VGISQIICSCSSSWVIDCLIRFKYNLKFIKGSLFLIIVYDFWHFYCRVSSLNHLLKSIQVYSLFTITQTHILIMKWVNKVKNIIIIILINHLHHDLRFWKVHPICRIYLTSPFLFILIANLSIYAKLLNGQDLHFLNSHKCLKVHRSQKLKVEANWNKSLYLIF